MKTANSLRTMNTLPDLEIFMALSALGLTVTGFSGLVAVLGRRAAGSWSDEDRLQLVQLLELSLALTFASLIPVLVGVAVHQTTALSISTVLVGVFHLVVMLRGFLTVASSDKPSLSLPKSLMFIFFIGGSLLIIGALASGFGFIGWAALFLLSNLVALKMI